MKTVLVTGSNGLLGQALISLYLKSNEHLLIATSSGENRFPVNEGYTYYNMDITSKEEVNKVFEQCRPDVVINTAAMTNVDACEENKEKCWQINVKGVQNLLSACSVETHFIHLSTDFVFDGKSGPYIETDLPNPQSIYAESKLASEELVKNAGLKNWAIARTIIVYGKGHQLSRSNIVLWAIESLNKNETLNIVDDQFRSPTWAPDLAQGCFLIEKNTATGIFHISGPETYSMYEMISRITKYLNKPESLIKAVKTDSLNRPAPRPPKTGFIIDKARQELGYQPHSLEESLKIIIK